MSIARADGFAVEAVHGQRPAPVVPTSEPLAWNEKSVAAFRHSEAWYKQRFGLLTSDEIQPEPGVGIGAFLRADRGDERTSDHHTLFIIQHPAAPRFLHSAFR